MKNVLALYHFVHPHMHPERVAQLREVLHELCTDRDILGTLLVAGEGINGTVSGDPLALDALAAFLRGQIEFATMQFKHSAARPGEAAFLRMKVKIKDEIVSFGQPVSPVVHTGEHVDARRWNELLNDPDVVVVDTRNTYEIEVGTFPGALNPGTSNFREFPQFVEQQLDPATQPRIAMFCTGGIRCEKASAYLLEAGFESVYQLDGGVLNYLETVSGETADEPNEWQGECFVFDQRVALDETLTPGDYLQCHACRRPLPRAESDHPDYVPGVSCPRCIGEIDPEKLVRFAERQRQMELAAERGESHIGPNSQTPRGSRPRKRSRPKKEVSPKMS